MSPPHPPPPPCLSSHNLFSDSSLLNSINSLITDPAFLFLHKFSLFSFFDFFLLLILTPRRFVRLPTCLQDRLVPLLRLAFLPRPLHTSTFSKPHFLPPFCFSSLFSHLQASFLFFFLSFFAFHPVGIRRLMLHRKPRDFKGLKGEVTSPSGVNPLPPSPQGRRLSKRRACPPSSCEVSRLKLMFLLLPLPLQCEVLSSVLQTPSFSPPSHSNPYLLTCRT